MSSVAEILQTMEYGRAPESEAHVTAWLERHADGFGHFIAGRFVPASDGGSFAVMNPARGTLLARVPEGTAADIDAGVAAARGACAALNPRPLYFAGNTANAQASYLCWRQADACRRAGPY